MTKIKTHEQKIEKARKLLAYFIERHRFFDKKWQRARKWENKEKFWGKYITYRDVRERAYQMLSNMERSEWLKQFEHDLRLSRWQRRKEEKAEKAERFKVTYRVFLWYMNESTGADYGRFTCEKCKYEYFHSPRTVYLGKDKIYDCVCGYCAASYTP